MKPPTPPTTAIEIGLAAAIVVVKGDVPQILVARGGDATPGLPFGIFDPQAHRTFEIGLRAWVKEQTGFSLGYVEQLYTFGDRGRHARRGDGEPHEVSVGYLALTRLGGEASEVPTTARLLPWYHFFPWEDWRQGKPECLAALMPALEDWAGDVVADREDIERRGLSRRERLRLSFGSASIPWDEEKALDRYELLYEAGLVGEALRDGRPSAEARESLPPAGEMMRFDHRRILATAISRLRAKLKYRPLIFELMPPTFTLTALQRTVEAIAGRHLHKQNFRRFVEGTALVEPTGDMAPTAGRPAAVFRFRREVLQERPTLGLRLGGRG
ncbi:NUDIX hydrolase [Chelatococcus asaccharovorans]|uniref:NrtR DNA-binding winged helix domain-containing protein n=1 Tax=Chelatococcus asaccharovorans TaxID=28210 RepID=A0A2V3U1S9_9HYPH|nr:NAD regulator [Chelatococcus asaccharovorans]MBS7702362.1 NAD regulator [Chelatococcus asaccharovorans]PXW56436.1 hypothetical protein C7450_108186 [Chelatococcus asaccharovorans]CAH1669853.1 conserved hypothetical protein [Chelatococcus asaccharovorans]CAH1678682.1 conserved hypothetical protein [Chelatococcus asaccharovorans]